MIFWPKIFFPRLTPQNMELGKFNNNGLISIFSFYLYVFVHFHILFIIYLFNLNKF